MHSDFATRERERGRGELEWKQRKETKKETKPCGTQTEPTNHETSTYSLSPKKVIQNLFLLSYKSLSFPSLYPSHIRKLQLPCLFTSSFCSKISPIHARKKKAPTPNWDFVFLHSELSLSLPLLLCCSLF